MVRRANGRIHPSGCLQSQKGGAVPKIPIYPYLTGIGMQAKMLQDSGFKLTVPNLNSHQLLGRDLWASWATIRGASALAFEIICNTNRENV